MTLFFWGARALYLGPAFGLSPHRSAVPVLCVGVHGPFDVARDPRRPRAGHVRHRAVLFPANTLHHLRDGEGLIARTSAACAPRRGARSRFLKAPPRRRLVQ